MLNAPARGERGMAWCIAHDPAENRRSSTAAASHHSPAGCGAHLLGEAFSRRSASAWKPDIIPPRVTREWIRQAMDLDTVSAAEKLLDAIETAPTPPA